MGNLPSQDEQAVAWTLRKNWATGEDVRLTLGAHCILQTIVGKVSRVSASGAFAVVDGWHVPCDEVLGLGKPTIEDKDRYAARVAELTENESVID